MKRVTTTEEHPDVRWMIFVDKGQMLEVMRYLIHREAYQFEVENDFGGTGGWRITFSSLYDAPEIQKSLLKGLPRDFELHEVAP